MTAPGAVPNADWVPRDACALPTAEQPLRVAEFDGLFAAALRAVERPGGADTRARLVLAGDEGLPERVRRLVEAETSCCSLFTFTVTPLPGDAAGVVVDVQVPASRADVLDALLDRAERDHRDFA